MSVHDECARWSCLLLPNSLTFYGTTHHEPLTMAALIKELLTTAPLTTAPLTTAPLTTAQLTTAPLTTAPLTAARQHRRKAAPLMIASTLRTRSIGARCAISCSEIRSKTTGSPCRARARAARPNQARALRKTAWTR